MTNDTERGPTDRSPLLWDQPKERLNRCHQTMISPPTWDQPVRQHNQGREHAAKRR